MKIVSDLSSLTDWRDVTFALDVLALVVGGGAGPGAAHAEHDDQEQDGRGGPDQHPDHHLEYTAVIGCEGEMVCYDWLWGWNTEL